MTCRVWIDPARLREGPLTVDGKNHHYMFRVRRLAVGDTVTVFDGKGHQAPATIDAVSATSATLLVGRLGAGLCARDFRVSVLLSLIKGSRMERCIETLTELGVAAIVPIAAARSIIKLDPARALRRQARFEAIARAAASQSQRADAPHIGAVSPLAEAVAAAPDGALKLILVTDPDAPLLKNALPAGGATAAWLLSGPEGDFSPDEITAARAAGFAPVSLGPLILRADTAPVTALAILNHLLAAPDK